MLSPATRNCPTMPASTPRICSRARCRSATSSLPCTCSCCDRSPPAIACARWRACSTGRQMACILSSVSGTTITRPTTTQATNRPSVCVSTALRCSFSVRASAWRRSSSCASVWSACSNCCEARVLMRSATVAVSYALSSSWREMPPKRVRYCRTASPAVCKAGLSSAPTTADSADSRVSTSCMAVSQSPRSLRICSGFSYWMIMLRSARRACAMVWRSNWMSSTRASARSITSLLSWWMR